MSFSTRTILDWQASTLPKEVYDEIHRFGKQWDGGFHSSFTYLPFDIEEDEEEFPVIAKYIKDNHVDDKEILIHFWW